MYELDPSELSSRGYRGPPLRISAASRGGIARFVNDAWAPPPLPPRAPNAYVELLLDPKTKLPLLVLFASAPIPRGGEALLDYGPAYWRVAARTLIREHAMVCGAALRRIVCLRRLLAWRSAAAGGAWRRGGAKIRAEQPEDGRAEGGVAAAAVAAAADWRSLTAAER
jgi:hypothetical protein